MAKEKLPAQGQVAAQIIEVCRRLHAKNMLAACDGNVSFRLGPNKILITPAGKHKGFIKAADFALIDLDGKILKGNPSSERSMHLAIYQRCEKAKCVVHAHPPTAIAWTIARPDLKELPSDCMSELILALGSIPIAPYARPSTVDMGLVLGPHLPQSRVILMARHGALSWGESVAEAYNGMERLEHSAEILKSAHLLGGLSALPKVEVAALKEMRLKIGEHSL